MKVAVLFKAHGPIELVWKHIIKAFGFEVVETTEEAELVITEDPFLVHDALVAGKIVVQFEPLANMKLAYRIERHPEFAERYHLFRTIEDAQVGGAEAMLAYMRSLLSSSAPEQPEQKEE